MLVGAKVDHSPESPDSLVQIRADAESLAVERDIPYGECSAKTGQGVLELLARMIRTVADRPDFIDKFQPLAKTAGEAGARCVIS